MKKLVESSFFSVFVFSVHVIFFIGIDFHDRHPEVLQSPLPNVRIQNFLVTAYTPDSGDGISGSGAMASGKLSYIGAAACPMRLKHGTRIVLGGAARRRAEQLNLPWELICEDRFRNVYREGIDINLPKKYLGLSDRERIRLAYQFGLVRSDVFVYVK